jgi:hypothetical protein
MIGWKVEDDEYTRSNIHAISGNRTHCLSVQAIKANASDRASTGTGFSERKTLTLMQAGFFTFLKTILAFDCINLATVENSMHLYTCLFYFNFKRSTEG